MVLILIASCKQDLNDILDTGQKIVINGLITTDSLLNVFISKSMYINDISGQSFDDMNDLDSAEVYFYTNNSALDSLYHVPFYSYNWWIVLNPGNYRSKSILPQPGKEYKIIVKARNLPDAYSTIIIPDLVKIKKVDTLEVTLPFGSYFDNNKGFICKIEFSDPVNETNYYLFNIREMLNQNYFSTDNDLEFSCEDPIVEEKLSNGEKNVGIAFSDKIINGQEHILNVTVKKESILSSTSVDRQTVCFRLYSISEEYFRYIQTLNLYNKNYGNPLADPVMLFSNISGGYGFFSGASVSSDSIVFRLEWLR